MRQQDGLNQLRRSLADTAKVKANDKAVYNEGVELLAAEKAEDDSARRKYGTDRWTREPSEAAARKTYITATEINGYLTSAQSSDELVEGKLLDFGSIFRVLTGTNRDLEAYVPSSRRATITPEVERESNRLRGCLNDVSRLESKRKRRIQALKEKTRSDDISKCRLTLFLLTFPFDEICSLFICCRLCTPQRIRPPRTRIPNATHPGEPI